MFPCIKYQFDFKENTFFLLDDLTLVTFWKLSGVDPERDDRDDVMACLTAFTLSLNPQVTMRIKLQSELHNEFSLDLSRWEEIRELGFIKEDIILSIERRLGGMHSLLHFLKKNSLNFKEKIAQEILESVDLQVLENIGINVTPLHDPQWVTSNNGFLRILNSGIELSDSIFGILKFISPAPSTVDLLSFYYLRSFIPLPYQIVLKVKKIPPAQSELLLRRKSSQAASAQNQISQKKYCDSEELLEKISLENECLLQYELYIILPRFSEEHLRQDARSVVHGLRSQGTYSFETFGAFPCFKSLNPGATDHLHIKESSHTLPVYFPLMATPPGKISPSSLVLHRRDHTLAFIDLFNPEYEAFSGIIVGATGTGKSVLTHLLTRALLNDPDTLMIKIDVGGSHSKETQLLNGKEYRFSLDQPSGINPFLSLKEDFNEVIVSILAHFLGVLMLEEGELFLSKELRSGIERELLNYASQRPQSPSLSDFLNHCSHFDRKGLLQRWAKGGIYQNALKGDETHSFNRLRYFNFSDLNQAQDPDFGQGGFALVMAQFNFEMIKNKKLVFIADETPFFIKRSFSFFKFSTANVRKFGGCFISISQKSTDLVVNNDTGIIENSPNRFLFGRDGEEQVFQERFKLSIEKLSQLNQLKREKKKFSEVLFQDKMGSRILKVLLTPHEYLRFSSTKEDNEKILALLEAVPSLTLEEAIPILNFKGHDL